MGKDRLEEMSGVDIMDVDERMVASFDEAMSLSKGTPKQTVERFLRKGYNPYFRKERGDGYIVKISFANNGVSLNDAVAAMLGG